MKEILLVEDSDADAEAAQYAPKSVGIANPLRRFVNGAEAMAHLNHAEKISAITPALPSVLLVDIKLPGMSGFEILEAIQHRPAFAKILRIVFSHLDDTNSIKRAYRSGAHSFLTKPVRQAELSELITAFPGYWSLLGNLEKVPQQFSRAL